MDRQQKVQFRSELFRHLDGIVTIPTAYLLHSSGVLDFILSEGKTTLKSIASKFKANDGYLNIALRVLASQGWLVHKTVGNDISI
ncbi:hypothetical protein N9P71_06575, partial [Saprospiraceae bacterium]|nr:hypothetical protein [Saprospiraceae bacterium]